MDLRTSCSLHRSGGKNSFHLLNELIMVKQTNCLQVVRGPLDVSAASSSLKELLQNLEVSAESWNRNRRKNPQSLQGTWRIFDALENVTSGALRLCVFSPVEGTRSLSHTHTHWTRMGKLGPFFGPVSSKPLNQSPFTKRTAAELLLLCNADVFVPVDFSASLPPQSDTLLPNM